MHWPEQLIVGGATRNVTSALRTARALQSVVQLMGEREMYEYWADHYKVHHVGWTQEKAAAVLDSWQRKFAAVSILLFLCNFIVQLLNDASDTTRMITQRLIAPRLTLDT